MAVIANLDINLRANVSRFGAGLKKAVGQVGSFKSKVLKAGKSASSAIGSGLASAAKLGAAGILGLAAAATAAATALTALTFKQFGEIDSLAKMSDRLNISTEGLAGLRHAADQTGAGAETLSAGLEKMTNNISEAAQGTGTAKAALEELGLSADQLNRLTADDQIRAIADAFQGVEVQADKTRLAMDIFGRSGGALVNTLSGGSASLDAFQTEAEKLGLTIDRSSAASVEAANDAIDELMKSIKGIGVSLAPILAGFLTPLAEALTNGIVHVRQFILGFGDHFVQIGNVVSAVFSVVGELFGSFVSILGFGGGSFESFKDVLLKGLITLEYTITNWQDVWKIAVTSAALGMIQFANDTVHFFGTILPKVMTTFTSATGQLFKAMWTNIANGFTYVWDKIKGNDAKFVWQPLTDGFKDAFEEIEKTLDRKETPAERVLREQLEAQQGAFSDGLNEFVNQRMDELNKTSEQVQNSMPEVDLDIPKIEFEQPDIPNEIETSVKTSIEGPQAIQRGSQAAIDLISDSRRRSQENATAQKQLMEQEKNNRLTERLISAVESSNLQPAAL